MRRRFKIGRCFVALALLYSGVLHAAATFDILSTRPNVIPSPFHFTRTSENLESREWYLETVVGYHFTPIRERATKRKIIERLIVQDFIASFGATDWLSIGIDFPVVWENRFQDPTVNPAPGFSSHAEIEDVLLEIKTTILDEKDSAIGLAFIPYIRFPTGHAAHFTGEETVSGGGMIAVDKSLGRFLLAANAGVDAGPKVNFRNSITSGYTVFLARGGAAYQIFPDTLDVSLEVATQTPTSHFFEKKLDAPTEAISQLRWQNREIGLQATAGGGLGIIHGAGASQWRAFAGLGYTGQVRSRGEKKLAAEMPPQEPIESLAFALNKTGIEPEHLPALEKVAAFLEKYPRSIVLIEAYADSTGPADVNMTISQMRARHVAKALQERGIARNRIIAVELGEADARIAMMITVLR